MFLPGTPWNHLSVKQALLPKERLQHDKLVETTMTPPPFKCFFVLFFNCLWLNILFFIFFSTALKGGKGFRITTSTELEVSSRRSDNFYSGLDDYCIVCNEL